MRKRSGALHCETEEEYIKLAEISQQNPNLFYSGITAPQPRRRGSSISHSEELRRLALKAVESEKNEEDDSTDEETPMDSYVMEMRVETTAPPEPPRPVILTVEAMLVGRFSQLFLSHLHQSGPPPTGTQSQFNAGEQRESGVSGASAPPGAWPERCLDLLVRKETTPVPEEIVYKNWLRNLACTDSCSTLLDVYYQSAQFFVFVYETYDRQSFEALCNAADRFSALNKRMFLILGISDPNKSKVVALEEVLKLQTQLRAEKVIETYYEHLPECFLYIQKLMKEDQSIEKQRKVRLADIESEDRGDTIF